ncbi:complex I assembly factor TIMMDC1, mitochondrial [Callorhinchus milii]|uniref:Complex I assembly factor TIMMDC1, mitochondrial n=1 Tax=Callorhinchus milii TaxID=7868 RepID=V9KYM6_CALMI|nr:complex I assembly factor TIMMDC1, mitochondrial-like [Callorhinchus milii]XP_042197794.1 complex I assembly factor TIMMDC1, mitochondrial [Callorhinchus milii]|eukprot:gi/632984991/ref/XP_007909430.1/ PREDICTED: complex I assembly factor TIMMDC1, mitochondrial [Callorhinchus milii]
MAEEDDKREAGGSNIRLVRYLFMLQRCLPLHHLGHLHLPRVLAAGDLGLEAEQLEKRFLPKHITNLQVSESGWDRIRELFDQERMQSYPEELMNIWKGALMAGSVGLVYGGIPAAQHARKRYIELSQAEVYKHRIEAVRSAHNAAIRGFIRYGWRWSWRVTAFVTVFNIVSTGLSVYRDQNILTHYSVAGAITGGLFRLNLGVGGGLAGMVIGAVLGLPTGALLMSMQKANGETVREQRRREQRELYQLKVQEWDARLNVTEGLIQEIDQTIEKGRMEKDLEKIEELLNRPKNPE